MIQVTGTVCPGCGGEDTHVICEIGQREYELDFWRKIREHLDSGLETEAILAQLREVCDSVLEDE